MNKSELVLAVFAASKDAILTPVQIQKLLFLIDKKIPQRVDGPHFNFEPYDYGPFDKEIYLVLDKLSLSGDIEISCNSSTNVREYRLTPQGQARGEEVLKTINGTIVDYIKGLSEFVRSLSFAELVSTIYKAYPEMKINSVFRG